MSGILIVVESKSFCAVCYLRNIITILSYLFLNIHVYGSNFYVKNNYIIDILLLLCSNVAKSKTECACLHLTKYTRSHWFQWRLRSFYHLAANGVIVFFKFKN